MQTNRLQIKRLIILFFILNYVSSFGQNEKTRFIEFSGVYETKCEHDKNDDEGTQGYLRFYSNGKVISASTDCDGTADDLKDWFNLEMDFLSIGNYQIKGKRIQFSIKSPTGVVKYKGKIHKDGTLRLKSKSLINAYRSREKYLFINIIGLK